MKQSNVSKYAYLAGLVDGEGCITGQQDKRSRGHCFVCLSVSQKDGRLIDWLHGTFGGSVYRKTSTGFSAGNSVYEWHCYGEKAVEILKRLIPFLRLKKRQAEIAIRIQARLCLRPRNGRDIAQGNRNVTEHEIAIREQLLAELRQEKHTWALSAAVEAKRVNRSMRTDAMVHPNGNETVGPVLGTGENCAPGNLTGMLSGCFANSAKSGDPRNGSCRGQSRAKRAEQACVCREQMPNPKGMVCSGLMGNHESAAEMTAPAISR